MRVLILSCNTGEGHNSAAKALKEVFDDEKIECDVADSLAYLSQKASNFICKWHVRLYKKMPKLFGIGYRAAEYTDKYERSMIYAIMAAGAKKLRREIEKKRYDTIICTHPFSAMTLTKAVKKYNLKLHTYFVATDYTCSPGVSSSNLDCYIIPHETLTEEFCYHGIPKEKIFAGGIPVSPKVCMQRLPEESKHELGIKENKRVILLMCGSMGCGPMKLIALKLSKLIKDNEYLVIICGNNKRLYNYLRYLDDPGRVRVLGFTRNIPDYMNSSELVLTKPGGLSTTEAAYNHLPMALIDAVSGCESHNMAFWIKNNMAFTEKTSSDLCMRVRKMLDNPAELENFKKNMESDFSENSAIKTVRFILEKQKM